jgi:hypothetical protein
LQSQFSGFPPIALKIVIEINSSIRRLKGYLLAMTALKLFRKESTGFTGTTA